MWGLAGEDGNMKKNTDVIEEQSQGDSEDAEVDAAYTVIKKDRRDSFSDEDESPMRERDVQEVDDFFNFVGDHQQERWTASEKVKRQKPNDGSAKQDKDQQLQLIQQTSGGQ